MNCPKCNKDKLYVRECFPKFEGEAEVELTLSCEDCRWVSGTETISFDCFPHLDACDCQKCASIVNDMRREAVVTGAAINENLNYVLQYLTSDPSRAERTISSLKAKLNLCDCGAEVARTTHANWCSKHG